MHGLLVPAVLPLWPSFSCSFVYTTGMSTLADLASTLNDFCKGQWDPAEEVLTNLSSAWLTAVERLGWSDMTIFAVRDNDLRGQVRWSIHTLQ